MARYDVYRNTGEHAGVVPYLLDVQSEVLSGLDTRIVIPLRRRDSFPISRMLANLLPEVWVEELLCIVETPKLAAVPLRILKTPVTSLAGRQTF